MKERPHLLPGNIDAKQSEKLAGFLLTFALCSFVQTEQEGLAGVIKDEPLLDPLGQCHLRL